MTVALWTRLRPVNVSRGGGKIPQSLCRDLQHHVTHEGSREGPLAKPERRGSSLALLASEKLTGLVQMENRNWLCRAVRV